MRTFWLYHGSRVLTAVRAEGNSSDAQVIGKALAAAEAVPGCFGVAHELPFEFRGKLCAARVVREHEARWILPEGSQIPTHVECIRCGATQHPGERWQAARN